jgi:hypothetical protein
MTPGEPTYPHVSHPTSQIVFGSMKSSYHCPAEIDVGVVLVLCTHVGDQGKLAAIGLSLIVDHAENTLAE